MRDKFVSRFKNFCTQRFKRFLSVSFYRGNKEIGFGDPQKRETLVGPIISEKEFLRLRSWINEAKAKGAKILAGGNTVSDRGGYAHANLFEPTVLAQVPSDCKISCEEAFGPVVILEAYENFADVIKQINSSQFGLQAGIFTDSARLQQEALRELDVGGVIMNDVPTYRSDVMPYGGMKNRVWAEKVYDTQWQILVNTKQQFIGTDKF